jgi:WD40 repeat protein
MFRATHLTLPTLALLALAGRAIGQEMKPRAVLKGHAEMALCLAFSPDGKMLASGSRGYDAKTRTRWGELRLWDVPAGKEVATFKVHKDEVRALAFSPDGKSIASVDAEGEVRLWDLATGQARATFPGRRLGDDCCIAFSTDGARLGTADAMRAKVYEVPGGKELSSMTRQVWPSGARFSPDLKTVAWPNHQDMDLWDVATGRERLTLPDHRGRTLAPSFTADGKLLAVPSRWSVDEKYATEVKLWDVTTGRERATIAGHAEYLVVLALSPDGKRIALVTAKRAGGATELKLLDVPASRLLGSFRFQMGKWPGVLAFSPDGRILAAAGFGDGSVWLWDVVPPR